MFLDANETTVQSQLVLSGFLKANSVNVPSNSPWISCVTRKVTQLFLSPALLDPSNSCASDKVSLIAEESGLIHTNCVFL